MTKKALKEVPNKKKNDKESELSKATSDCMKKLGITLKKSLTSLQANL